MGNKAIAILLGGLIFALIFLALTFRFDLRGGNQGIAFRIDRLTGRVSECVVGSGCKHLPEATSTTKERQTRGQPKPTIGDLFDEKQGIKP